MTDNYEHYITAFACDLMAGVPARGHAPSTHVESR